MTLQIMTPNRVYAALIMVGALAMLGCAGEDSSAVGDVQSSAMSASAGNTSGSGAALDQAVGVLTAIARAENFEYELEALGTARANEAVEITTKVSNLVTAIRFREGEIVHRGEVLVELNGAEAGAELAGARAALSEARSQYQRSRELFATQALSQSQLDQLEATLRANEARVTAAEAKFADTVIRAPFDGRTGLRRVSVGSLISPGTVITTLDDTSVIKLDFAVPETFMAMLKEGLAITARSVAFPNREFTGTIATIDSRLDPTTRAIAVRATLPNPEALLKPGMFLTVRLKQDRGRVVTIPEEALVPEEGRQFVFVMSDDRAHKREIKIGQRKPGTVEVVTGLAAGEVVIVEGTQKVRDGALVRDVRNEGVNTPSSG